MDDEERDGITRGLGRRLFATGKIASSAARLVARRAVGAAPVGDSLIAEQLARELDQMKGMAMKVGQILSYFEGTFPPEVHAALQRLQRGAQPVAFGEMAAVFEAQLGMTADEAFDAFERKPVAAASIGQVYRARLDGREVAVKIQYPGIRDTIEGDFGRLQSFARLASLATSVDGPALVRELRERFVEECDYRREAEYQTFFRSAFAEAARARIPRVIEERSAEAVLTTEWCEGRDFYRFAAEAAPEERNDAAQVLVSFALRSLFELRTLNADPHPGNYLFAPDAVVFLDFGCVRRFDPHFIAQQKRLMQVVVEGRRDELREAMIEAEMAPRPEKLDFDVHWQVLQHLYAPYTVRHFRFSREHVRRGLELNGPGNPNARHLAIPPQWVWFQRLIWGLHTVLARLEAEGDFRVLLEATWSGAEERATGRASPAP